MTHGAARRPRLIRRSVFVLVAGAAAAVVPSPVAAPSPTAPSSPEAPAPCGQGSWVAGTVDLCAGELVHRDYVLDDHGSLPLLLGLPDGDAFGFLPPAGAADAPQSGRVRDNLADLVALRLRVDDDSLDLSAELNTVFDPADTVVVVALDTDADPATRSGAVWPGLVANPFLARPLANRGNDLFVTMGGADPDTNVMAATVPRPPGERWRIQAVTAEAAGGTVRNVAFRGLGETGFWWENHQAAALSAGDIAPFATEVDVADLTGGVTRRHVVPPGGVRQRVYISEHNPGIGEGVSQEGVPGPAYDPSGLASVSQAFNMLGRYQPYGFYEPTDPGPHGLQLLLHGLAENHSGRLYFPLASGRIAEQAGEAHNRILAAPLGRGWKNWWSGYGERDVLDVYADVIANYDVDVDQVVLSGLSMGGYGTFRLAALHPDLFAGAITWVGALGDFFEGTPLENPEGGGTVGALGAAVDLLGNLKNVPIASVYAAEDQLVPVPGALEVRQLYADLGLRSILFLHLLSDHVTPLLYDEWAKEEDWTGGLRRVAQPSHVRFRTDQRFFMPVAGIVPDRAYWVSAVVPAGPGFADVDARSFGCGTTDRTTTTQAGAGVVPVPWVSSEVLVTETPASPPEPRLELALSNVASLAVDGAGACLSDDALTYRITTDQPVTLTFVDGRSVAIPGAGTFEGVLPAAAAPAATGGGPAPAPGALPATGAPATGVGLGLALLALAAALRRRHA